MVLITISVLVYAVLEFLMIDLMDIIHGFKRNANILVTFVLFLCFGIISNLMYILDYFQIHNVSNLIKCIIIIILLFSRPFIYSIILKKANKKIILTSLAFCIVDSFFEVVAFYFFSFIRGTIECKISEAVVQFVVIGLINLYIHKKNKEEDIKKIVSSIKKSSLIFLLIFVFYYLLFIYSASATNSSKIIFATGSIFSVIMIIFLIVKISISSKNYEDTSILLEKQLNNQVEYYEKINNIYNEFRSFRHDYKNHILCLRNLIADNNISDAVDYLNELSKTADNKQKYYDTGNNMINALLTDKSEKAAANNITISFNGFIPASGIKNIDLCTIFANAVDNAVEACMKDKSDEKKEITIESNFNKGYFFLVIKNPVFKDIVKDENGNLLTSKSGKEHHGFGVANIKSAVKKYDGHTEIENNDSMFKLSIDLLLKQNNF